jgi:hypothetical protein
MWSGIVSTLRPHKTQDKCPSPRDSGARAATRDLVTEQLRIPDDTPDTPDTPDTRCSSYLERLGGALSALPGSLIPRCSEHPRKTGTTLHRRTTLHPDDEIAPPGQSRPPGPSTRAAVPARDRDPARRQRPTPSANADQPSFASLYQRGSAGRRRRQSPAARRLARSTSGSCPWEPVGWSGKPPRPARTFC